jgi:phage portal protein BeeE
VIIKIGKFRAAWGKDAKELSLVPGRILRMFGLSVQWVGREISDLIQQGYCANPDIYTVINRIAKTASNAPFKVYRIKDKKKHLYYKAWTGADATPESLRKAMMIKELVYEEDTEHPLNKLIENPNPNQKSREFIENSIGFKLITGERFWHVVNAPTVLNGERPYAIFNLPPQYMIVEGDGTMLGIRGYRLQLGEQRPLTKEEVIFSRYWNPDYDTSGLHLRGLSPLKAGSKLTTLSNSGLTRSVAMIDAAGAAGVLHEKPTLGVEGWTKEQAGDIKKEIHSEILGTENSNSVGVLSGDLGWINFGMKGSEMELLEMQKLTRERIAVLFNAPPGLFDPEKSGEHNAKEFKKELITSACIPELDSIRDDWNEIVKLYPEEDIYVDYDLTVFPELSEDHGELAARLLNMPYFTWNEKRLMFGADEDTENENMDKYIIPSGMMLLDDLGMNEVDEALNDTPGDKKKGL